MSRRLAYLGPPGTFSEEAGLLHDPEAQLLPFVSVAAVAAAVDSGMADEGVVAIENSLEGSVNETLDILIHESGLSICRELVLPIDHCLLAAPGASSSDVEVIYSHPQALGQCRRFLERCFPKAQMVAALSTAAAVEEMLARSDAAAIETTAERRGQTYVLNGQKRFIDGAQSVDFIIVAAKVRRGGREAMAMFCVDTDRPGYVIKEVQSDWMGFRGLGSAWIAF